MFCKGCGKKISDNTKFCPYCGTAISTNNATKAGDAQPVTAVPSAAPEAAPAPVQVMGSPAGMPHKKGGKKALLAVIAVLVILVCASIAVIAAGVFASPKSKVKKAMRKSWDSYYGAIADKLDMDAVLKNLEKQDWRQSVSIKLKDLQINDAGDDAAMLEGLGIQLDNAVSLPKREMGLSAQLKYGEVDLFSGYLTVEDKIVKVFSPNLLQRAIGCDTEKLSADLEKMGASQNLSGIDFNLFDMLSENGQLKILESEAGKVLADGIVVEKAGSDEIDVNGYDVKCTEYTVEIPQEALFDFLDVLEKDIAQNMQDSDIAKNSDIDSGLEEIFDGLNGLAAQVGDLTLTVYLNGGKVVCAEWNDYGVGVRLELGGEKEYADAMSLTLSESGMETMRLESVGNHIPRKGLYTDETRLMVDGMTVLESSTEYDTKAKEDNFSWELVADDVSMTAAGTLSTGKEEMRLELDDVTMYVDGDLVSLEGSVSIAPYSRIEMPTEDVLMLGDMNEETLAKLEKEVETQVQGWIFGLFAKIPELQQYLR